MFVGGLAKVARVVGSFKIISCEATFDFCEFLSENLAFNV